MKQLMNSFLTFQEACGTVEPSAMRGYRYGFVPEPLEKSSQARLKSLLLPWKN